MKRYTSSEEQLGKERQGLRKQTDKKLRTEID